MRERERKDESGNDERIRPDSVIDEKRRPRQKSEKHWSLERNRDFKCRYTDEISSSVPSIGPELYASRFSQDPHLVFFSCIWLLLYPHDTHQSHENFVESSLLSTSTSSLFSIHVTLPDYNYSSPCHYCIQ